ncbi:MAG: aminodeoxychorismate/anthranilate synthase component II [Candidatus Tectomicrobia bacterium]|uniref:Aminodeoxychorismate/anthranilate synthase component II n=1 Tax=Tectimicrobiota bacterium TaxID=2528274 RepID=A0A932M0J6_UNCTE|nr:aminodeoxychorismate/anthranilate synthase component II [Candidatus Tectomicrobia bacterium]
MILVIDNYDSFTYNLVQYFQELGAEVVVRRNDAITLPAIRALPLEGIVLSPGPRTPAEAGITPKVVSTFAGTIPILGVCLGHQAIGWCFGGRIGRARRLMHGKKSTISHDGKGVFRGLPNPLEAIRYHSLAILEEGFPDELEITARSEDGEIMGVRHRSFPVEGVQFHPESILTERGKDLLANFLHMIEMSSSHGSRHPQGAGTHEAGAAGGGA